MKNKYEWIDLIKKIIVNLLASIYTVPIILFIRTIRPLVIIRISELYSDRIGHFAANTELYLCEKNKNFQKSKKYLDIFCNRKKISNQQLALMWKRVLNIWPACIVVPIIQMNKLIPGGELHVIKNTQGRDVDNLYDQTKPHLNFTNKEILQGQLQMVKMGIPAGSKFICLIVRDDLYLKKYLPEIDTTYHNYRNSSVENYLLTAEKLAEKGFYVVRMGVNVNTHFVSKSNKIIDYANSEYRSDFMDIFLGANCTFCISTGTGFDAIPEIFRKPVVYVNYVPVGLICSFRKNTITIFKHHYSLDSKKMLTLSQIFSKGVGYCKDSSCYELNNIKLVENSPQEILDAVSEMLERVNNQEINNALDEELQTKFWDICSSNFKKNDAPILHGNILGRYGASFLRNNPGWLL